MSLLPTNILYGGATELRPAPLRLRAGPLTAIFEPDICFLRSVRLGDHEVVRGIYAAVRDENWGTIPARMSNLQTELNAASFHLTFDVEWRQGAIDFSWRGEIQGEPAGRITFIFDGEARSSFLRNRIGICVLHPILECAGQPCSVERVDGTLEEGTFPRYISPHQPFKQIRALTHEVVPGVRAEVRFDGEVFEMEDQRNWTDASYKTYGTPLDLPRPARVEMGTRVRQSVTVSLLGAEQKEILPQVQGRSPQLSLTTTPVFPKPALGLGLASHGQPLTAREVDRLKRLRLSHLRVDLRLAVALDRDKLQRGLVEAEQLGVELHLALFFSSNAEAELDAWFDELQTAAPRVALWMIFQDPVRVTDPRFTRWVEQRLSSFGTSMLFAAGTNAFFVELNRQRPEVDSQALPCYSITPQVHAFDQSTLIENLAGQAAALESARQWTPRAVVISPITLRGRFNPDAAGGDAPETGGTLPAPVDVRQMSLFGAGWTLGSIAQLAVQQGLHSLTYFETTGWRGIMETEHGSPLPELFRSVPGMVFPIYHVLAEMADFNRLAPTHSSHPLQVGGLTLLDAQDRRRILVANFLGETQDIKIETGTCPARVRSLDEQTAETALLDPETFRNQAGETVVAVAGQIELRLLPYALAVVDLL